jgi:hypothetical protein
MRKDKDMLKRHWAVVVIFAVMSTQTGCFTTRIITSQPAAGPAYTDRQWFTIGGLANLSAPAGRECANGLSSAESKLSVTDWLINVGLSVAGGVGGALACANSAEQATMTYCAGIGSSLVPFLLSSRTVEYTCAQGPSANARPAWMPPAQGNTPAATASVATPAAN